MCSARRDSTRHLQSATVTPKAKATKSSSYTLQNVCPLSASTWTFQNASDMSTFGACIRLLGNLTRRPFLSAGNLLSAFRHNHVGSFNIVVSLYIPSRSPRTASGSKELSCTKRTSLVTTTHTFNTHSFPHRGARLEVPNLVGVLLPGVPGRPNYSHP